MVLQSRSHRLSITRWLAISNRRTPACVRTSPPGNEPQRNNVNHGFLRASDGTFTTFDVPQAGTGAFEGTIPAGSNPSGATTGFYSDSNFVTHGFIRAADGTIVIFDAPGAVGTGAISITPSGAATGSYSDANFVSHGFVRTP